MTFISGFNGLDFKSRASSTDPIDGLIVKIDGLVVSALDPGESCLRRKHKCDQFMPDEENFLVRKRCFVSFPIA